MSDDLIKDIDTFLSNLRDPEMYAYAISREVRDIAKGLHERMREEQKQNGTNR